MAERNVYYIDTGSMSKQKAEKYLHQIMKNNNINTSVGWSDMLADHMTRGLCIRFKDGKMCDKKGTRIIGSGSVEGVTITLPMRMCDKHYQWYIRDKQMRGS